MDIMDAAELLVYYHTFVYEQEYLMEAFQVILQIYFVG